MTMLTQTESVQTSNGVHTDVSVAVLEAALVSRHFLDLIPHDFARRHLIISQGGTCDVEHLTIAATSSAVAVHNVGVRLGRALSAIVADAEAIARVIDEAYGAEVSDEGGRVCALGSDATEHSDHDIERLLAEADRDLLTTQGKGPIVKLLDALLFEALGRGGSDVHVQPMADRTLVRYRLDGVLHTVRELPPKLALPLISRIKVIGRMDIAERRIPQDGRASVTIGQRPIDLRISTLPTSYGERAVIRLLDNSQHLCEFSKLGMPQEVAQPYLERASRANGMILLTGPTGSGKTTTLYATLRKVGSSELNIMTIEDPIEYELSAPGIGLAISQSQVNARKGVTFATGLRHILRQDPDVVMVGEIRDSETARIAIQASLTGHLVFSTLHTNDSASAVTRLIDLGIEPFLVSSSLSAVLAQRLVRTLHQECGGSGCSLCLNTGFRARTGLFELLVINEPVREVISRSGEAAQIRTLARASGTRTLREDGARLVAARMTTQAEVDRVVHGAF